MANPIKIYTKFKNRNDKTRTNGSSGFKTHRPQRGKAVEHGLKHNVRASLTL